MPVSPLSSTSLHQPAPSAVRPLRAEVQTTTDGREERSPTPGATVVEMRPTAAHSAPAEAPISSAFEAYLDSLSDAELAALEEMETVDLLALVDAVERPETRPVVAPRTSLLHMVA